MYFESYDLALFLGIVCMMLGGFLLAVLAFPEQSKFSIFKQRDRQSLIDDYKNPKIVAGGIIGIIRWLLMLGSILILFGLLIRLVLWVTI